MGFGDLKKAAGLSALNDYLADRSFIEGYTVSQGDVVVFQAMSGAPSADLCNALRWYNQVKSYSSQFKSLPGVKKSLSEYGTPGDKKPAAADDDDDDSDVDLFGDDDDDEAELKAMQEQKKAAAQAAAEASKKKKKAVVAKSTIILDVKPWDDETDMAEVEKMVRGITLDGLRWNASKLLPVGYGIFKLQISCVVEDDKVGTDDLEERITSFEDLVQSMDIVAFNKV